MLSVFPQLLFLSGIGVTLLRITVGVYFLYLAYLVATRRDEFSRISYPVVGLMPSWAMLIASLVSAVLAGMLIAGIWTQVVALFGILMTLKLLVLPRRLLAPITASFPRSTAFLLLVLCVSLVVLGAGAFAFDLPL